MKSSLQTRVLETIERHSMMRSGDRIGVAVSGGADSVALLRMLGELGGKLGIRLAVLHFHHQLRGAEADEDERFVGALALEHGFHFVADRADVAGEAKRNGWNLEDAGRRLRYEFFESAAAAHGLNRVAVAHTADDQAETVLARLFRGTGPTGLTGIYPVVGPIVRPLLDIRRAELREYLVELNQPWREDATNQDTSRTRARIRHNLLPLLEQEFDPAAVSHLARLASLAAEEESFWRALEEERFATLTTRESSGACSIAIADLICPLPQLAPNDADSSTFPASALTRRLVRRMFVELRGHRRQLTSGHVEDVLKLATKSPSGSRIELPGALVERRFDRLVFSSPIRTEGAANQALETAPGPKFQYAISLSGVSRSADIDVPEIRKRFKLKVIDWHSTSGETIIRADVLDFDKLRGPLILRNWLPGDSYRPHQRRGIRKLKRIFLESRIPRRDRATWPVVTSAGALAWVSKCPVAEEFAVSSSTRTGVWITEEEF